MKTVNERFEARVIRSGPGECWTWRGAATPHGYGKFFMNGRVEYAHRAAYELATGERPEGKVVCHRCDNPGCVNPAHLFAGTHAENSADMVRKGRGQAGERHWKAKLTGPQVAEIRTRVAAGETQRSLAREFGVSFQHIGTLVHGKARGLTWGMAADTAASA